MMAALCVAAEDIIVTVRAVERSQGRAPSQERDLPPQNLLVTPMQYRVDFAAPCTKLRLGTAPPRHTACGMEGRRQEGQTDRQSMAECRGALHSSS